MNSASDDRPKERSAPRISASKLAEFVQAGTRRRGTIVHDQKFPSPLKTNTYKDSDIVIRKALMLGGDLRARLDDARRELQARNTVTSYQRTSQQCALEVIAKFAAVYEKAKFNGVTATSLSQVTLTERVKGVVISSRPLVRLERASDRSIGALLLVSSKSYELSTHAGQMVALLLHRALSVGSEVAPSSTTDPSLCVVIDVQSGRFFTPPVRTKVLTEEIEAACLQIAGLWPLLERRRKTA